MSLALESLIVSPLTVPVRIGIPSPSFLHEFFERQAGTSPDQMAVECGSRQVTYSELERRANQLAQVLRSRGVSRGSFVALLLPRSIDMIVGILAVLKSGAAYVPLDPGYPSDRVSYILDDVRAKALITCAELRARAGDFAGCTIELDAHHDEIESAPAEPPSRDVLANPSDLCYVIYTSGSTGRPKGVEIEHASACHLVATEGELFHVGTHDRVFQGFSIAFDASVEEVWLALSAGATLVVGTSEMLQSGAGLVRLLTETHVSVLSCVPTLLAMMEDDVPSVRLLILGGEACPQQLVSRWWRPDRRMFNTYGPTEATVIATAAECRPGRPVTIGRAIAGYSVYLFDPEMRPVGPGEPGELHIGGVGLARGYVRRDDLTREKFVSHPLVEGSAPERLYKTGDLGRLNAEGEIEFLGRVDTQVKLRGFRIELTEIESVLLEHDEVGGAAVSVRADEAGTQQLVAYICRRNGTPVDLGALRTHARSRLPAYMVPSIFEPLADLPTLPSGKVDRNRLPAPRTKSAATGANPGRNSAERKLADVWAKLFSVPEISLTDDFFLDLGGHSLLAARMVSELRNDEEFSTLSMLDIYHHPTIESLAGAITDRHADEAEASTARPSDGATFQTVPPLRYYTCVAAQVAGLYVVLGLYSLQWLFPYLTYTWMIEHDFTIIESAVAALGGLLAVYPLMLLVALLTKWTVIGRYKAGHYPLWGSYYFRWWFVNAVTSVVPINYLAGTPLLGLFYRLMGAKIGDNVHMASDNCSTFDLLSVGDDSSIGTDASLDGCTIEQGLLKIGPIEIGSRCFVGTRAVLREHTRMDDDSRLDDLSLLPRGGRIPAGETWLGSPARPARQNPDLKRASTARPSRGRRVAHGLLFVLGVMVFPLLVIGAIFPGMMVMNYLNAVDEFSYSYLVVSPLVALSFVVFLCLEIAAIKWLLLGKVRAGSYPITGSFYFRKWFVDQTLELSLDVIGTLYSTIYLIPWYRLLGAKLGRRAEISTASFISPDLLSIDDEGFIADCASLGAARVEGGMMTIAGTHIGKRSFIGNSALLPPGVVVGDNCLIGCLSAPPPVEKGPVPADTSWLGSPAMFLPARLHNGNFAESTTFAPSRSLWLKRGAIEFCRVVLPSTFFIALTCVLLAELIVTQEELPLWHMLLLFPIVYAVFGSVAALIVIALKWLLMGRYRAGEQPLWSTFVWRTELISGLQENLSDLFLVGKLTGTPLVCWFFRMMGAKIGKRVYLGTTQFTEYDLVEIGDDVALNTDSTIQTHLFEDRVMKMSRIKIGDRASVGAMSLVLYDTVMGDDSTLGDLSLLMKGEALPAGSHWQGIPARCGN